MKTPAEKLQLIRAHHKRARELFFEKYPDHKEGDKLNSYFWNKCREQAAREVFGYKKPKKTTTP